MAYLVVAYPKLSVDDFARLQSFRKSHDALYYDIVAPHFTLVFPIMEVDEAAFIGEVALQCRQIQQFDFCLRCATVNKDAFKDVYHCFLVPDEGNSNLIRLHDQLYSGVFQPYLRADIDYIPHIGAGNSGSLADCRQMAAHWNGHEFEIRGRIEQLSVLAYKEGSIRLIEKLHLC